MVAGKTKGVIAVLDQRPLTGTEQMTGSSAVTTRGVRAFRFSSLTLVLTEFNHCSVGPALSRSEEEAPSLAN